MASKESGCSRSTDAVGVTPATSKAALGSSRADQAHRGAIEGSHDGAPLHHTARPRSLPSSPSLSAHSAPPPPSSTPSSPLCSLSPPTLLLLDAGDGALNAFKPTSEQYSSFHLLSPLAPASSAGSQPPPTTSSRLDLTLSKSTNKPTEDLVAPLLQSFASLQVEDRATTGKAQPTSPPLCLSPERATLLTKNGTNPYFVATVARVKESQQDFSNQISQVDQDVVEVRAQAMKHLTSALQILVRARERVGQQQLIIEGGCDGAKESVEDLESKLRKAQRDITTLRAEHIATKGLLEQMTSDVASLRTQDEDLRIRVQQTNASLTAMSTMTEAITSLIEELRTQNSAARRYTYAPRPSFASDTSVDETSPRDSASSSRSHSFAEASPEVSHTKSTPADRKSSPGASAVGRNGDRLSGGHRSDSPSSARSSDLSAGTESGDSTSSAESGNLPAGAQNDGPPAASAQNNNLLTGEHCGDLSFGTESGGSPSGAESGNLPAGAQNDGPLARGNTNASAEGPGGIAPAGRDEDVLDNDGSTGGSVSNTTLKEPPDATESNERVEESVSIKHEPIVGVLSREQLSSIAMACQDVVESTLFDLYVRLSVSLTRGREWLIAVRFFVPRWAYLLITVALVSAGFVVYLRSSRLEPPSTKIDSPIWESLGAEL